MPSTRVRESIRPVLEVLVWIFVIFIAPAIFIVYQGSSDTGQKADLALVANPVETPSATLSPESTARLDRAVALYNDKKIPAIVVAGDPLPNGANDAGVMAAYLQQHGVPQTAISEDHQGDNIPVLTQDVAVIMKERKMNSVMVVSSYYHIPWLQLALEHAGAPTVFKSHVGSLNASDAWPIEREVIALYIYVGRTFGVPVAKKVVEEARACIEKALFGARKAQDSINSGLESMPSG